jgi:hypothetical protein
MILRANYRVVKQSKAVDVCIVSHPALQPIPYLPHWEQQPRFMVEAGRGLSRRSGLFSTVPTLEILPEPPG